MRSLLFLLALVVLFGCSGGPSLETGHGDHTSHSEHGDGASEARRVTLTEAQVRQAGIEITVMALRDMGAGLETTGVLEADPDLQVELSSRVAGVVTALHVRLGESVSAGSAVAEVESPDLARAKADYHHSQVESELAGKNLANRRRLARLGDETQRQVEQAQAEVATAEAGVKTQVAREEVTRRRLERLEALLEDGIASLQQVEEARADQKQAQAELLEAKTELKIARQHLQREVSVRDQGLRVSKEVWDAQANAARSQEETRHNRELLELLGASPETHEGTLLVRTPLSGQVTSRVARRGQRVEAGEPLVSITDLSRLWLWVDLYARDLGQVKLGMPVSASVEAYPQRTFTGKIDYIDAQVNPTTRTTRALVVVSNRESLLKPGMYARVQLLGTVAKQDVAVPSTALVSIDGEDAVYVSVGANEFERRLVKVGPEVGDYTAVEGLEPGEKVVFRGAFALKSVDQKEKMGGHEH